MAKLLSNDELMHHGILGQKWGVRRYQNKDGSLTAAGKKRYGTNVTEEDIDAFERASNNKRFNKTKELEANNPKDWAKYGKVINAIHEKATAAPNRKAIEWAIGKANIAFERYNSDKDKAYNEAMDDLKSGKYKDNYAYDLLSGIYKSSMLDNKNTKEGGRYEDYPMNPESVKRLEDDFKKVPDSEVIESLRKEYSNDDQVKRVVASAVFYEKYANDPDKDYYLKSEKELDKANEELQRVIIDVGRSAVKSVLGSRAMDISELPDKYSFGDMEIARVVKKLAEEFDPLAFNMPWMVSDEYNWKARVDAVSTYGF